MNSLIYIYFITRKLFKPIKILININVTAVKYYHC